MTTIIPYEGAVPKDQIEVEEEYYIALRRFLQYPEKDLRMRANEIAVYFFAMSVPDGDRIAYFNQAIANLRSEDEKYWAEFLKKLPEHFFESYKALSPFSNCHVVIMKPGFSTDHDTWGDVDAVRARIAKQQQRIASESIVCLVFDPEESRPRIF
jgi:hypothetical protein